MMMRKDGGPAFPRVVDYHDGDYEIEPGMSLRDWFAGMALAGMMANPEALNEMITDYARACYAFADAMLAERERGES